MPHIVTFFAAKWYAACYVASKPAAYDAGAPLRASCLMPRPRLHWLVTVGTLDLLRVPLSVNSRHTLVLLQLLCSEEFSKFLLTRVCLRWIIVVCCRILVRVSCSCWNQGCSTTDILRWFRQCLLLLCWPIVKSLCLDLWSHDLVSQRRCDQLWSNIALVFIALRVSICLLVVHAHCLVIETVLIVCVTFSGGWLALSLPFTWLCHFFATICKQSVQSVLVCPLLKTAVSSLYCCSARTSQ